MAPSLHKNASRPALISRIAQRTKPLCKRKKQEKLTKYQKEVKYLLEIYATDEVSPETDTKIVRLTRLLNRSPIEYVKLLWAKVLPFNREYDEYVLKENFIEGLKDPSARACACFGV